LIPEHVLLTVIGTGTAGTLVGTTIDLTDDKIVGTALDYGFTVPARRGNRRAEPLTNVRRSRQVNKIATGIATGLNGMRRNDAGIDKPL
jgi:hypothetical protein